LLPAEPQLLFDCAETRTQTSLLQQPSLHDAAVHSHLPAAPQAWPLAQPPQAAPALPQLALL